MGRKSLTVRMISAYKLLDSASRMAMLAGVLVLAGCGGGDAPDSAGATADSASGESVADSGGARDFASSQPATLPATATPNSTSPPAVPRSPQAGGASAVPSDESAFAKQMRGLLEQGDAAAVVNQTTAAIERDPNNTEAYLWRGAAHLRQRQVLKAAKDLDTAISIDAEYIPAYKNRAIVRYAMGKRDEALADLSRAAQLAPQDAGLRFAMAKFYWDSADLKNATAQLSEAISLSPNEALYYSSRAVLYWEQGEAQLALTDATRAIEMAPEVADAYVVRGRVLVDSGQYEQGIADLTQAISINPKQADALEKRGHAYFMLGDRAHADADRLAAKHARRR